MHHRLTILLVVVLSSAAAAQDRPPNLVVFLADDAGAECFGCYGGESYETPAIDRLAREGLRFDNAFTQPLCTPTRVELLTGRSNARNYVAFSVLPPTERTFAHDLRDAEYRTYATGKWQLLAAEHYEPGIRGTGSTPAQAGFDGHTLWQVERLGQRHWRPVMTVDGVTKKYGENRYGPDIATANALRWIDEGGAKPFLLFWPMILPHGPFIPPPGHDADGRRRNKRFFKPMVEHLDGQVGRLVSHLRKRKLDGNTVVLFIGDNGSPRGITSRRNGEAVRGGKAMPTDTGSRVPFVLWAPGLIDGGRTTKDLVSTVDVLPTLLELAGVPLPKDRVIDGRSFLSRARTGEGPAREWVAFHHHPRPKTRPNSTALRWARDARWQLFDDGRLFDMDADPLLTAPIADGAGGAEAAAARTRLARGLASLPKPSGGETETRKRGRPAGSTPKRKNVLFLIADDLATGALSCYGNVNCKTPAIDALAARGVRFTRAYCQFPVCGAARAALMSGMYPQSIGVMGNGGARRFARNLGDRPSMSQLFRNAGYHAARVSKIYHMRVPGDITAGVDGPDHAASWTERHNCQGPEWMTKGSSEHLSAERLKHLPDKHYNLGFGTAFYVVRGEGDGSEQADVKAATKAIEILKRRKDEPFFLAVGFVRPHVPLVAPEPWYEPYPPGEMELPPRVDDDWSDIPKLGISHNSKRAKLTDDAKKKRVLAAYYASCAFMDAQVGRILKALDDLGLRDDTIVVFTSDHGYHLGEHDFWQKMSLHDESARIPLIVSAPGVEAGVTASLAQQIDIYPTLASLAGLKVPAHVEGKSLVPVLRDRAHDVHHHVYCFKGNGGMVRSATHAYIEWKDGSAELYDMVRDPHQFTNVVATEEMVKVRDDLRMRLKNLVDSVK